MCKRCLVNYVYIFFPRLQLHTFCASRRLTKNTVQSNTRQSLTELFSNQTPYNYKSKPPLVVGVPKSFPKDGGYKLQLIATQDSLLGRLLIERIQ